MAQETPEDKFAREHAAEVQMLKDQLLVCLVKRAGGVVEFPVDEVDGTSQDVLYMEVDHETRKFTLTARKKS